MNVVKAQILDVQGNYYIVRSDEGQTFKIPQGLGLVDYNKKVQVSTDTQLLLNADESPDASEDESNDNVLAASEDETNDYVLAASEDESNYNVLASEASEDLYETVMDENDNTSQSLLSPAIAQWTDNSVRLLISLYKEKKSQSENGRIRTLKRMWEIIKQGMSEKGYMYTVQQIENKWKSLERSYKTMIENRKKTGRGRKNCPFQKELSEVLDVRSSINPPAVIDQNIMQLNMLEDHNSEAGSSSVEIEENPQQCEEEPTVISNKKRKRISVNTQIIDLKGVIEKRTKTIEEIEAKKYEQRERIFLELKRKNDLFEKYFLKDT